MARMNLSFKNNIRDLLIYEFLIAMQESKSPSQYIKDLIENDSEYIKWREAHE